MTPPPQPPSDADGQAVPAAWGPTTTTPESSQSGPAEGIEVDDDIVWQGLTQAHDWLGKLPSADIFSLPGGEGQQTAGALARAAVFHINGLFAFRGLMHALDPHADPFDRVTGGMSASSFVLEAAGALGQGLSAVGVATGTAAALGTASIVVDGAGAELGLLGILAIPYVQAANEWTASGAQLGGELGFSAGINGVTPTFARSELLSPFTPRGFDDNAERFSVALNHAFVQQYNAAVLLPQSARDAYSVCALNVLHQRGDAPLTLQDSQLQWVREIARAGELGHAYCLGLVDAQLDHAQLTHAQLDHAQFGHPVPVIDTDHRGNQPDSSGADGPSPHPAATTDEQFGPPGPAITGGFDDTHQEPTDGQPPPLLRRDDFTVPGTGPLADDGAHGLGQHAAAAFSTPTVYGPPSPPTEDRTGASLNAGDGTQGSPATHAVGAPDSHVQHPVPDPGSAPAHAGVGAPDSHLAGGQPAPTGPTPNDPGSLHGGGHNLVGSAEGDHHQQVPEPHSTTSQQILEHAQQAQQPQAHQGGESGHHSGSDAGPSGDAGGGGY